MGVGTSKGAECSVLRAWSISWPELCHVNEARLSKDTTQYWDALRIVFAGWSEAMPLHLQPPEAPHSSTHSSSPDWHLKGE